MNNNPFLARTLKIAHKLSPGFLILGLCLISWASYQIFTQSAPAAALIEPPKEQLEPIALAPEAADAISETEEPAADAILYPIRPAVGGNIGNLILPAIDQTLPIFHGTDEDELSRGIGHFAGSVLPGENDNAVLSGHRDTVFRELGQLEITDQLIVETSAGTFTYEIREIKIVPSDDRSVITPTTSAVLTVTTCYPFDFLGSAPDRYILIADLVNSE
ncbi:class D sortase [Planococcus sp. X10-3]|uniref:class D sortase n=1 Tax=Planococcus sp. X10-3 TaxID=3061240 RepID=UPI003BB214AF